MNNKIIDISVKRAQLKKNKKDNSILYDEMDEVDQDEYELLQGIDIATYPDGTKYVGEWKDGIPNGQGTLTYLDGRKYIGEFKDGIPNGQGSFTYLDEGKYVGEFKNDKAHGQGTFTFPDGFSLKGIWEKNEFKRNKRGIILPTNKPIVPSFYYRYAPIIWLIFMIFIGGILYHYILNLK